MHFVFNSSIQCFAYALGIEPLFFLFLCFVSLLMLYNVQRMYIASDSPSPNF